VGAVLNKATGQGEYGSYDSYQPYVMPGASTARHWRSRENGLPQPSGQ
jgi:hypothetical protein